MNIAVIPDGAMIIINPVNKHGHTVMSATNFSKDQMDSREPDEFIDYNKPPFNMEGYMTLTGNKYTTNEVASGIRGRLSMFDNIIKDADAAIILGAMPEGFKGLYDELNEMILFGCVGCNNTYNLLTFKFKEKKIPMLFLKYPTTRDEIIHLINKINKFLDCLDKGITPKNDEEDLSIDIKPKMNKLPVNEFKNIINSI